MDNTAWRETDLQNRSEPDRTLGGYATLAHVAKDGGWELDVLVDGAHCAACIRRIETALLARPNVTRARFNFSTRRLSFAWEGPPDFADSYIAAITALGYRVRPYEPMVEKKQGMDEERFLLLCLGVAGFAMGNIMLLSIGLWTTDAETMGVATRDFMHWISALIAIPTVVFAGRPFFNSAFRALSAGTTNMDVPISVALVLTTGMSLFETMNSGEHAYFDSVVMLMFFLLIGRYLDFRVRRQARGAARTLLGAVTGFANVVDNDGSIRQVPVKLLKPGMVVRVAAGEKIPGDGTIIEGDTTIDMALVTGETMPHEARLGGHVYAGTLNLSAPVTIKILQAAQDTLLSDVIRLMEKAEQAQARYVRLADRMARLYTPVVHILAAGAFIGWFSVGLAWQPALMIAATVLIITCPCALALAVPVVQVLAVGKLMKEGVLVKSGDALERLASIDTVLLDKTGTLTFGRPELDRSILPDPQTFKLAASLASYSAHPLSRSLRVAFEGSLESLENVREHPGKGMEGTFNGQALRLGRPEWVGGVVASPSGRLELWFRAGKDVPRPFYFSDRLRDESKETIEALTRAKLRVLLLSGDREEPVRNMAAAAGISDYRAQMTPVDKYKLLEDLRRDGHKVLMVGDGLNDAPTLAGADVSISPASASDLAQNAADIVFTSDSLEPILTAWRVAIFSQRLVRQNFALAIFYNILAIPMAIAGYVTPVIAALAMSGSSLVVIGNSFRLKGNRR